MTAANVWGGWGQRRSGTCTSHLQGAGARHSAPGADHLPFTSQTFRTCKPRAILGASDPSMTQTLLTSDCLASLCLRSSREKVQTIKKINERNTDCLKYRLCEGAKCYGIKENWECWVRGNTGVVRPCNLSGEIKIQTDNTIFK